MIEGFDVPFDNGEIDPIVVGVALDALLAGAGAQTVGKMQSLMGIEAASDLGVTLEALEGSLSPRELVTIGTMRSAIKTLVSACQRAGRDLCSGERSQQRQAERQENRTYGHGSGKESIPRAVHGTRCEIADGQWGSASDQFGSGSLQLKDFPIIRCTWISRSTKVTGEVRL